MMHLLKYRLIQMIRNKNVLFWSIIFPFALSLLFYFSFMKGGEQTVSIDPVKVAVTVEKESLENDQFLSFIEQMDGDMLEVKYISESKAKKELKNGKIKGIYIVKDGQKLVVSASGVEESILETLLNTYQQNEAIIKQILISHPENLEQAVKSMGQYKAMTKDVTLGGTTINGNIQFFFSLIGMSCLYGCFLGFPAAVELKANLRPLGARRCVTLTRKASLIFTDMIVSLGLHFIFMTVFLLFLKYVLKLGLDGNFGGMMLVCLFGSMIGVGMGIMVGSIGKAGESVKLGIMVGISMLCSFLSGLMFVQMKYIVEQYAPIINRINPAAVISDALYCLAVYNDQDRYFRDLATLFIMSVVCIGISYLVVRREQYESI